MTLAVFTDVIRQKVQRLPASNIATALSGLLVLLLAWIVANISWQLMPLPVVAPLPVEKTAITATTGDSKVADLSALQRFALFGKAEAEPVAAAPVVTEAPKTSLNVKLTGVVAIQGTPETGSAIIESRGNEATYSVNDTIEGTRAVLKQVFEDRVLIQQQGRFETLMLDGIEYTKIMQANAGLGRADEADMGQVVITDDALAASPEPMAIQAEPLMIPREELIAEPLKFFDYIRVTPHRPSGQLAGYRLMPGKNPALFQQLGLQANDLAVEINGIALNDMQQAMTVMNELRDAREASIKIERDGETRDILVSLSQ